MSARITIVGMYEKADGIPIDTTSRSGTWSGLSPFLLGPCRLYAGRLSRNVENAWQYSKVYEEHTKDGEPTEAYWQWAEVGWNDRKAHRYPMGKGRKPLYSLWAGHKLGYIEARKMIYVPLYAKAVLKTNTWTKLKELYKELYEKESSIVLRDYDGYDHDRLNMNLTQVLNEPRKKMGHAFVLKMLLTQDKALIDVV